MAHASEDIPIHSHYVEVKGVLPEPYDTFSFKIQLDHETDDVVYMSLVRGDEEILFPPKYRNMLQDVELSTLKLTHGMYRDEEGKAYSGTFDSIHIHLEVGEYRRVKKEKDGIVSLKRGRDRITLYVTKDNQFRYYFEPLAEQRDGWYNLPKEYNNTLQPMR